MDVPQDKDDSIEEIMKQEGEKYRASITGKIETLENLISEIKTKLDKEAIQKLHHEAHKLAGSAGTYGYNEASVLCKKCVTKLEEWEAQVDGKKLEPEKIKELETFLEELKKAFQKEPPSEPAVSKKEKPAEKKPSITAKPKVEFNLDLYIINSDTDFLALIEKEGRDRQLRIKTQTDAQEALKDIQAEDFNPRMLIAGPCLSKKHKTEQKKEDILDPYNFIEEYRKKRPDGIGGLILTEVDFSKRLEAMKKKIDYVLEKPVSVDNVLNLVESIIPTYFEKPFKVLILDDDPDMCGFVKTALGEINVEVQTILKADDFFVTLKKFMPQLILLDLSLANFNGLEVLKALRSDAHFGHLPVVVESAFWDVETIEKAYQTKADDYIVKPIKKEVLQSKVLYFARALSFKEITQTREPLTGIYTERAFLNLLTKNFEKIRLDKGSQSLVYIGINKQEEISKSKGNAVVDKIIVEISNLLTRSFRLYDLIGRIKDNGFGIFLNDVDAAGARQLIERFLKDVQAEIPFEEHFGTAVKLSAGVAVFPADGKNAKDLVQSAKNLLFQAETKEDGQVVFSEASAAPPAGKQEIFILDDDLDIQRILRFAFEKRGFQVTVAGNVKETMELLEKRQLSEFPLLIIFDRMLPDGDGLEVYRQLKKDFANLPPVLFLSKLSSEKDVIAGLKEGAVDYIAKPFSLSVLMEKALKLLAGKTI